MSANPRVRPLEAIPVELENRRAVILRDPWRFVTETLTVSPPVYALLSLMDGTRSVFDVQRDFREHFKGRVAASDVERLVAELDEHYLLETERFEGLRRRVLEEFRACPTRPAAHAGTAYEGSPDALRAQLDACWQSACSQSADESGGNATPSLAGEGHAVRALITPHIDPRVGGRCAARAFAALKESTPPPDLFVVFGTAHQPGESLFILTEKPFETPLGAVEVDQAVAQALIAGCPFDLKQDEFLHKHEHSIEFQLIFLQHLYSGRHAFRILPILVGSFHEFLESNTMPSSWEPLDVFSRALRRALADSGRRVCYVAAADLSHIGRKFRDDVDLSDAFIEDTRSKDREMLDHLEAGRYEDFFRFIQCDGDRQKVCGLPPIYAMLHTLGDGVRGKLLEYDLNVEEQTQSFVSYASMVFYEWGGAG